MTSKSKQFKIHRATAKNLLDGVIHRIQDYNHIPCYPYCIPRAVVFGSYVNDPQKEMLSDLDIGLEVKTRHDDSKIRDYAFESLYEDITTD